MTISFAEACAHEAAHAVVLAASGCEVLSIRVHPDERDDSHMRTTFLPPFDWSDDDIRLWQAMARSAVAGNVVVPGTLSPADFAQRDKALGECARLGVPYDLEKLYADVIDILETNSRSHWRLLGTLQSFSELVMTRRDIAGCLTDIAYIDQPEYHI